MISGANPKTAPAERSNWPAVSSKVIPSAISPSSGMKENIELRFSAERNASFLAQKMMTTMTSSVSGRVCGC